MTDFTALKRQLTENEETTRNVAYSATVTSIEFIIVGGAYLPQKFLTSALPPDVRRGLASPFD